MHLPRRWFPWEFALQPAVRPRRMRLVPARALRIGSSEWLAKQPAGASAMVSWAAYRDCRSPDAYRWWRRLTVSVAAARQRQASRGADNRQRRYDPFLPAGLNRLCWARPGI